MASHPVDRLDRTLRQAGDVLAAVRADQASLPTPCAEWDVRALVAHILFGLDKFTQQASGGHPDWTAQAPDPGSDWVGTFRARSAKLLDAWRAAGDLSGTLELPGMGAVPATFPLEQQVAELGVHTWDLARATDQHPDLDPALAEHALGWARQAMRPEFRGPGTAFGVEQQAPADASAHDRLAAFFGRRVS